MNVTSNHISQWSHSALPNSIQVLYAANNSFHGNITDPSMLPASLIVLDVSYNQLTGVLPANLPASLAVLNASNNQLNGTLPSKWASVAELRLDNNSLTGKLPSHWSNWGSNTSNAIQLSLKDNYLHGNMPQPWVQQFCLATVRNSTEHVLFRPLPYAFSLSGSGDEGAEESFNAIVQAGSPIVLVGQHASINVTLGSKSYSFSYSDPNDICSIPNAVRNVALSWGIFTACLLVLIVGIQVWLRRKHPTSPSGLLTILSASNNKASRLSRQVAAMIWFLATDVAYYLYSLISDGVTMHQVFKSGHLRYAYMLLAVFVLPFLLVWVCVAVLAIRLFWSKGCGSGHSMCRNCLCAAAAGFAGIMLSPLIYVALVVALLLEGVGLSVPHWCLPAPLSVSTAYRSKSVGESALNALPQAILQSKLYIMGNDPNGVRVYIDTILCLFSVVGSLSSVLSTVALVMIEVHESQCGVFTYIKNLLELVSFPQYKNLQGNNVQGGVPWLCCSKYDTLLRCQVPSSSISISCFFC